MHRALSKLKQKPYMAYIDGLFAPKNINIKCKTFIKVMKKLPVFLLPQLLLKLKETCL